jgi:potassium-transporting ATPase KdpC subunit
MRRQIVPAIVMFIALTVVCGVVYPLVVAGIGNAAFHSKADGSLVKAGGKVVGSSLIGQNFTDDDYFHPRPSAAGEKGYDPTASGASNLGPTNPVLLKAVAERVTDYRKENGLSSDTLVPSDAVTASASGLDPWISIANARLQAQRVATARGTSVTEVKKLIDQYTDGRDLGVLGDPGVNVLELNLALDRAHPGS